MSLRLALYCVLLLPCLIPAAENGSSPKPDLLSACQRGPQDAPVTILEFADFECPFCSRIVPVMDEILRSYPGKVRLVFKANPLSFHAHAVPAQEAAYAAAEQGKFWQMHDLLFANQSKLDQASLIGYAGQLGLDVEAFRQALERHTYRPLIERAVAEARDLGVSATPTFFINGQKVVGAQTVQSLRAFVDKELGILTPPEERKRVTDIRIEGAPFRGAKDAAVTIVEFSDFQCAYCARANPVMQDLIDAFPGRVKWVFKHFPLDFHRDAPLAHRAALAAGRQGKFWEMHDRIFANQREMGRQNLLGYARELHLNLEQFTSDLDSEALKPLIDDDKNEGLRLEVGGTPTFFINGKMVEGVRPYEEFRRLVQQELFAAPAGAKPEKPADAAGTRGPAEAPVDLFWFTDLESPLSPAAARRVREVMDLFPGKLRLVFKHLPLPLHPGAVPVHEALAAAGAQGKFWEMQDQILSHQGALGQQDLLAYAAHVGIDRGRFAADLEAHFGRAGIDRDLAEAEKLRVRGSPVFFVNAQRIDGIQPLTAFQQVVEAELKRLGGKAN